VHYRGARTYRQFKRVYLIATNGQLLTHPPSALPSVQWSISFTHNLLPDSPRQATLTSLARQGSGRVARQISLHESANEPTYLA
jgi:hypothetical protein